MTRSRLDAVFKEWNPYQIPVGVLKDQRKIGQLSLARRLHNTQHGYAYFEGKYYTRSFKGLVLP
ncbi:hypothetical protein HanRHA438_Chr02g0055241 [Helianthus annuus]|nr:hypothetical protein HanRHA438_Chr02g0055241 [Helianthus annuus]